MENFNHIPAACPSPATLVDIPAGMSAGAAGAMWSDAVRAGRTASFFAGGAYLGNTAPTTALDAWLANPGGGHRIG